MTFKNTPSKAVFFLFVFLFLAIILGTNFNFIKKNAFAYFSPEKEISPELRVLTVLVKPVKISDGYQFQWPFVGRVEAARSSNLGFEFGGLLTRLAVDDGDTVKKGNTLARLDTDRLFKKRSELMAALKEAQAALVLYDNTLGRTREAFNLNAVSVQQLDEAQQQFEAQSAVVNRIDAQLKSIDLDIEKSRLIAPFKGIIAQRFVDEGSVVVAGQPVFRLLDMNQPQIRVGIRKDLIAQIEVGQTLPVKIGGRDLTAIIRRTLPNRSRKTLTVDVLLTLPNAITGILDGDLAELTILDEVIETGYWLPLSALTESSRGIWSCYVAESISKSNDTGTATHILKRRQLELLHYQNDKAYVRGTLAENDLVVTTGLHRVVPSQLVDIQSSNREEQ